MPQRRSVRDRPAVFRCNHTVSHGMDNPSFFPPDSRRADIPDADILQIQNRNPPLLFYIPDFFPSYSMIPPVPRRISSSFSFGNAKSSFVRLTTAYVLLTNVFAEVEHRSSLRGKYVSITVLSSTHQIRQDRCGCHRRRHPPF